VFFPGPSQSSIAAICRLSIFTMTSDSDSSDWRERLRLARHGDAAARSQFLKDLRKQARADVERLLSTQFPRLMRHADASDVLQEVILRLLKTHTGAFDWSAFDMVETAADCRRLVARITRNTMVDLVRDVFGRLQQPIGWVPLPEFGASSSAEWDPPQDTYDPEKLALWKSFHDAVKEIPEPLLTVVELRYYGEATVEETAAAMKIASRTVKKHWAEARSLLVRKLGANPFDVR
jgi:RNA polymerase sigma factor (sigma-70 family)